MAEITVLGLGLMGTALAETMVAAGRDVAVWNRTASRADGLVAKGAHYLSDPAQAIAASPITIVCLTPFS